ncbi:MAG: hypothetical protein JWR16_2547 [Nevskia sp.]|nr:hypothetical protein [Nevskia sp.]
MLTIYEREQLATIREWLAEMPGPATRTLGKVRGAAAQTVQKTVPTAALKLALDAAHTAAVRLSDRRSILRRAGVDQLEDLLGLPLETCDRVASAISRRAITLAGISGGAFGVAGSFGLIADVPTLLIQTLRTIHRVGLSYGEDCSGALQRRLPIAIFALASANDFDEKQAALRAIEQESERHTAQWRAGIERAAQRELVKDAAMLSLNNLARQLAKHLGWRKAAGTVPVTGALISGSVNAWYLHDVARNAQRVFQLRWLRQKYGELPGGPVLAHAAIEND